MGSTIRHPQQTKEDDSSGWKVYFSWLLKPSLQSRNAQHVHFLYLFDKPFKKLTADEKVYLTSIDVCWLCRKDGHKSYSCPQVDKPKSQTAVNEPRNVTIGLSAAARVLGVVELLGQVLMNLGCLDLIRSMSVSHHWDAVIKGFPPLRQLAFFEATGNKRPAELVVNQHSFLSADAFLFRHYIREELNDPLRWAPELILNPLLPRFMPHSEIDRVTEINKSLIVQFRTDPTCRSSHVHFRKPKIWTCEMRFGEMLISNPPFTTMQLGSAAYPGVKL